MSCRYRYSHRYSQRYSYSHGYSRLYSYGYRYRYNTQSEIHSQSVIQLQLFFIFNRNAHTQIKFL